tara:strand:- start:300 stop:632 length:333 start_codon:yes stop_codon:yes gene_type:complete
MSHFGDLLAGKTTAAPVVPPVEEPVVEAPGTPASVEPDIAPPVPPVTTESTVIIDDLPDVPSVPVPTWSDLNKKSKYELEQIGRTIGIELDRRLSHNKLVDQLLEAFANQ